MPLVTISNMTTSTITINPTARAVTWMSIPASNTLTVSGTWYMSASSWFSTGFQGAQGNEWGRYLRTDFDEREIYYWQCERHPHKRAKTSAMTYVYEHHKHHIRADQPLCWECMQKMVPISRSQYEAPVVKGAEPKRMAWQGDPWLQTVRTK